MRESKDSLFLHTFPPFLPGPIYAILTSNTIVSKGGIVLLTDTELYRQFLTGNVSAYDELLIRLGDGLTLFLNGYLHNWQDAEDLMIEAFARIMAKKPSIREGGFKAYLYKTARNLASRFHERAARRHEFALDDIEEARAEGMLPEEQALDEEKKEALHACLDRIDPELREALWLIYWEGMSYEQAASVMKVSKKRVDHLLTRGKAHMRKELEKEGFRHAFE